MKTIPPVLLLLASLNLIPVYALAQPSSAHHISFQGALNGTDGKPLPNGDYKLTFRFWDGPAPGGNPVSPLISVPNVRVAGGVVSTTLSVETGWFNGQTRYIGVSINDDAELLPRVLITAVPYAMRAYSVADVDGDIRWGSGGILTADQGGSLEIGDSKRSGSVPFIDFHYGTGTDEDFNVRMINDADGVALAAIQGLNGIVREQRTELQTKTAQIEALEHRLAELERFVTTLTGCEGRDEEPTTNSRR